MKKVHLICNAHLDPVWQWQWEEGAGEALSTFRIAADICEQNEDFIFCHNEAMLYEWVEEYDSSLFERIQKLVKAGKWHIMGGWYIQPDCLMTSGESIVRQIITGKTFFRKKFGVSPTTAVNFDSFGHSRGLVQILAKSGYDSYLVCRPHQLALPDSNFVWEGFDGSKIDVLRNKAGYNAVVGKAKEKLEAYLAQPEEEQDGAVLWGIGNHGGGPSRVELKKINAFKGNVEGWEIVHSTPENYFAQRRQSGKSLLVWREDIAPFAVGCYTSMHRVKDLHRTLENEYYAAEKIASAAALQCGVPYPKERFKEALKAMLFMEFHDILPGTSVQKSEQDSIRTLGYAREIVSRIRAKAFFALADKAKTIPKHDGWIPIAVYNPHPYVLNHTVDCEVQLDGIDETNQFVIFTVYDEEGNELAYQMEKTEANIPCEWRKRIVFDAVLKPSSVSVFYCKRSYLPEEPKRPQLEQGSDFVFDNGKIKAVISHTTGLLCRFESGGRVILSEDAFQPVLLEDIPDPWGINLIRFDGDETRFGTDQIRIIEEGPIRTVVEAIFSIRDSRLVLRYTFPKNGTEIDITARVYWMETDKILKLAVPLPNAEHYIGQTLYGSRELKRNGDEMVSQKWLAAGTDEAALIILNDCFHGSDYRNGELRLSLLRAPAYTAHPLPDKDYIIVNDRYLPRIDQGEHFFRFRISGGPLEDCLLRVEREAQVLNEQPFAVMYFPKNEKNETFPFVELDAPTAILSCFKMAEAGDGYIVRLFEPAGVEQTIKLKIFGMPDYSTRIMPYEIKTLAIDFTSKTYREVNLLEQ